MKKSMAVSVIAVEQNRLMFSDGSMLYSNHEQDCCEEHFISFKDLDISDFSGLEFDLSSDAFLEKIPGYGVALRPLNGHPVRVPGYGFNNGFYSDKLTLVVERGEYKKMYIITECQFIRA